MQTPPHLKIRIASLPVQVLLPILSLIHLTAHSEDPQQASFHQFSPSEDAGAVSAHSAATLVSDSVATAQKVPGTLVFLKVGCNLRPGGGVSVLPVGFFLIVWRQRRARVALSSVKPLRIANEADRTVSGVRSACGRRSLAAEPPNDEWVPEQREQEVDTLQPVLSSGKGNRSSLIPDTWTFLWVRSGISTRSVSIFPPAAESSKCCLASEAACEAQFGEGCHWKGIVPPL